MTLELIWKGDPRTKKNHQQIHRASSGRPFIAPGKEYQQYRKMCIWQVPQAARLAIDYRVNVRCVYYMRTHRRCDLVNLLEATCDILTDAGVVLDDHSGIIAGHDGSRVQYDKHDPRVEITITPIFSE